LVENIDVGQLALGISSGTPSELFLQRKLVKLGSVVQSKRRAKCTDNKNPLLTALCKKRD
jgi:hypothetical protein